jgi:hypothetical protein
MFGNRAFSLFPWMLIGIAVFCFALSLVAMLAIGVPEPSILGLEAIAAGAYGRHLLTTRKTTS